MDKYKREIMWEENKEIINGDLNINWSKFKVKANGKSLEKAKNGYIEFCKMLNETDFELVGDYIGNKKNIELKYGLNNNIKLSVNSKDFKRSTYKGIVSFKKELKINNDKFIHLTGLTNKNTFIAKIKTFDGGIIDITLVNYFQWNKSRQYFYNKLKEVNGYTNDCYIDNRTKISISIDRVKLNPISPNIFKTYTYKRIINFKKNLIKNGDEFIKFIGLNDNGSLIAKIKTFNGVVIDIDINAYNRWNNSRSSTYNYCEEKGYKILSQYTNNKEKILIDFNCGHKPHHITPSMLKQNYGCPICSESKGEKTIRLYLESNSINFIQEYRFNDCKHKSLLRFDFYIEDYNLCIEFDGRQHFEAIDHFGGEENLKLTQTRDKIKNKFCKGNGINLIRIPYWELENVENILNEEFERLRKELKEAS